MRASPPPQRIPLLIASVSRLASSFVSPRSSAGGSTAEIGVFRAHRGAPFGRRAVAVQYIPAVATGCVGEGHAGHAAILNRVAGGQAPRPDAIDANGVVERSIAGDQTSAPATDRIGLVGVRSVAGDHTTVRFAHDAFEIAVYSIAGDRTLRGAIDAVAGHCSGVVRRAALDHGVEPACNAKRVRIGVHVSDDAEG